MTDNTHFIRLTLGLLSLILAEFSGRYSFQIFQLKQNNILRNVLWYFAIVLLVVAIII